MTKFSIVTPSFNQGQFIEDTIRSVLSQKGEFSIEYIIADGGSTDGTPDIVKKYDELLKSGQFPIRCKGISFSSRSGKDRGQSAAINEGFSRSHGDILAWINSDDYYADGVFEKVASLFENDSVKFIYGDAFLLDLNKSPAAKIYKKCFRGNFNNLTDENFIHQSTTFFRRELFFEAGGVDENLEIVMDHDLWIKMFKIMNEENIFYVGQPLASYRMWPSSKTYSKLDQARREKAILDKRYRHEPPRPYGRGFSSFEQLRCSSHIVLPLLVYIGPDYLFIDSNR
jgi:glycosyltransferase involved in cell wall biosynthesis